MTIKIMKRITYVLFSFLLLGMLKLAAQDSHFSHSWATPLLQNPSLAGTDHDLQVILDYRNQWNSVASPYKSFNFSADLKLTKPKGHKGFLAAGINVLGDKAGDAHMGTNSAMLSVAYHLLLNKNSTIGAGIMGGVVQRSIDYSQLKWASQYDGSYNSTLPTGEPGGTSKFNYATTGAGVVWTYKKNEMYISGNDQVRASAGVSVFQPHQPDYSFYKDDESIYAKIVLHGNGVFGIKNTNLCIAPGFVASMQGKSNELFLGALFKYILKEDSKYTGNVKGAAVSLGMFYRNKDAFVPTFFLEMGQYSLGLSYDVNISGLKQASSGRGGFEISLRFVNPNPFLYKSASRI